MAEVEKGTRFDIILLDVLMPGENGMAAAREIREYDSNVKIIFLTSSTEFAVESYAVDAWYYQLKPIRREDFFPPDGLGLCGLHQGAEAQPHPPEQERHRPPGAGRAGLLRGDGRTLTFHLNNGVVLESMGRLERPLRPARGIPEFPSVPTAPS